MAYCVYCTRLEGVCSKVSNMLLKVCSKWFTKNRRPENTQVAWIVESTAFGLQTCSWYLAVSQRRMAMSSKHSHSKGNSLPPAKRFDFIMILRSCSGASFLKKWTQTRINAWSSSKTGPAQGTITAAQPLKGCWMTFSSLTTMVCSHSGWASLAQKHGSRMVIHIHPKPYALPDGPSATQKSTKEEHCQLYGGRRLPLTMKFAGHFIS